MARDHEAARARAEGKAYELGSDLNRAGDEIAHLQDRLDAYEGLRQAAMVALLGCAKCAKLRRQGNGEACAVHLAYVIEQHPYLSGLQTDDHLHWLSELAHKGLRLDEQPEKDEEPSYEVELGYDTLPEELPGAIYEDEDGTRRVRLGPKGKRAYRALKRNGYPDATPWVGEADE